MKIRSTLSLLSLSLIALYAWAGGSPEFVKFPAGYGTSFFQYATMNRTGQPQLAKMYANAIAVASYRTGKPAAPGSVMVMEIYKPKTNTKGQPVTGKDGLFQPGGLTGVAVMERRSEWDANYPEDQRAGGWGFAFYNPNGTPKENTLACAQCHEPLAQQDHLFSRQNLVGFISGK